MKLLGLRNQSVSLSLNELVTMVVFFFLQENQPKTACFVVVKFKPSRVLMFGLIGFYVSNNNSQMV